MRASKSRFNRTSLRSMGLVAISLALGALTGLAAAQTQYATTPDPNSPDYPSNVPGAPDGFDNSSQAEADPPSRVARVSLTQGSVSLEPAGTQDWANADVNRPLTTGDKLWTDQNSRAELDIGSAAVRMGSTTGFSFLNLDDHTAQMQVTAGTLIVRVRDLTADETFEIDTPNLAVALVRPGQYRVEVNEAGDTTIVEVSEGEAQATGNGQGFPIRAQQRAQFVGTDRLSSVVRTLGAPDDLDEWSLSRDRMVQSSTSQQYVSPEATGYSDLDNNGRWVSTPDYGYVWTPTTVEVGWAPYRFGHWVWISPWGWTWIDNAPWGFAPFHYGRWVTYGNAWCWVPGPRRIRPVYAPALVGWIGAPGVGVSVAIGAGVSWFPLGPREVYVPGYRVTPGYVQRINVTNTTINRTYITNVYENRVTGVDYVNRDVRGGVTSVSQAVFTSAQPVWRNRMNVPESTLRNAQVSVVAPRIAPVRQSLVGAGARMNVRTPPPVVFDRTVLARTPPPRPTVSFDRQSEAIRANGGRPLGGGEIARLQQATPAAAPVRMIGANRGGLEPSLGDRERAIRDGRFGEGTPRMGRPDRPPSAPQNQMPQPSLAPQPNADFNRPRQSYSVPNNGQPNERQFERPNQFQRGEPSQRTEPFQRPDRFERPAQPPQEAPRFEQHFQTPPQPRVVDPPRQAPQLHVAPPPSPPPAPQVRVAPTPPPQPQPHNESRPAPAPRADYPHQNRQD